MLLSRFKGWFLRWLYRPLAFSYDLVAAGVSFGHWNDWGRETLRFVRGSRVLELGHGPGYLLISLRDAKLQAVGLDESPQMGRLALHRLRNEGYSEAGLVRGLAQCMPFLQASFDTVVSTFPSEYIFDAGTLAEVRRVLTPGGRLIVLPVAWPANPALGWLFRVTGESPAHAMDVLEPKVKRPFMDAGFQTDIRMLNVRSGTLMIMIATPEER